MPPGIGYPPQSGSPQQQVAAQELGGVPQDPSQGGAVPNGVNPVAFYLSNAADALVQTGPTQENASALEQFLQFLQQMGGGGGGQQPAAPPPQPVAPQGQAPAGPAPVAQGPSPLPPPGSPLPS